MAEIGGTYGLAAGISVMTIFEFIELSLAVLAFIFTTLCCTNSDKPAKSAKVYATRE